MNSEESEVVGFRLKILITLSLGKTSKVLRVRLSTVRKALLKSEASTRNALNI